MNIKINTNISSEYQDIEITINSPSLNKQAKMIIDAISSISNKPEVITVECVGS